MDLHVTGRQIDQMGLYLFVADSSWRQFTELLSQLLALLFLRPLENPCRPSAGHGLTKDRPQKRLLEIIPEVVLVPWESTKDGV